MVIVDLLVLYFLVLQKGSWDGAQNVAERRQVLQFANGVRQAGQLICAEK